MMSSWRGIFIEYVRAAAKPFAMRPLLKWLQKFLSQTVRKRRRPEYPNTRRRGGKRAATDKYLYGGIQFRGKAVRACFVGSKLAPLVAAIAIAAAWEAVPMRGTAAAQEDARSAKFLIQSCQNFLTGDASQLPFLQGRCFGVIDGLAYGSPDVCPS